MALFEMEVEAILQRFKRGLILLCGSFPSRVDFALFFFPLLLSIMALEAPWSRVHNP
jgi:hypothetical protein